MSQAEADLETVDILISSKRYYMACFAAQQSAEKAIKAYLYGRGEEFVFGHSIAKLCKRAAEYDVAFLDLRKDVKNLDQFYVETRYPNGLPDEIPATFFDLADAERGRNMCGKVLDLIRQRI